MKKKVNLFASFKKEKSRLEKEKQGSMDTEAPVRIKMTSGRRLVVSFIISAAFFCICLLLIGKMTAQEETCAVYVAVKELPENLKMGEDGSGYVSRKKIPLSLVPKGAVTELSQITGCFSKCSIAENQILSVSLFADKKGAVPEISDPVEVSIGTNAIAQVVGGTIREGDLVNISTVRLRTKMFQENGQNGYETVPVAFKAYVTETFTSSGISVSSEDDTQPVTVINILIPASEEAAFYEALEEGILRVSRIL